MLNLNQIYTAKSSATTAIRKAISRNQCAEGDYEARKVDGGFQIFATNETETPTSHEQQPGHETWSEPATPENAPENPSTPSDNVDEYLPEAQPEPPASDTTPEVSKTPITTEIPDRQLAVLKALAGAKSLEDKAVNERAGVWIVFADVHDSNDPHNLPKPAVPGVAGALKKKHLIETDWGKDGNGKRAVIVALTAAGIAALQVA